MNKKKILFWFLNLLLVLIITIGILSIPLIIVGLLPCSGDGCIGRIFAIIGIPTFIASIFGYGVLKVLIENFT